MQSKSEKIQPVKFTFGTSFGEPEQRVPTAAERALKEAVDAARAEGYAAGHAEGSAEAHAGIEEATQSAVAQLAVLLAGIERQHAERTSAMKVQAAQIAFAIAARLVPALMRAHPLREIETLVSECLANCPTEPRLVLRVAEALVESLNARMDSLKAASGYAGQVILLGDPGVSVGDCRIEWPDGGLERDTTALMDDIEKAVQRYVMASA